MGDFHGRTVSFREGKFRSSPFFLGAFFFGPHLAGKICMDELRHVLKDEGRGRDDFSAKEGGFSGLKPSTLSTSLPTIIDF